ncbi:MAG: hypothetical protein MJ120_04485 [Clostridia bacterium]|nr:hypothetical protein [Clostridia bacterium]
MANKSVLEKIITPAVSLVCTAAICITGAACVSKVVNKDKKDGNVSISAQSEDAYMTEAEAAAYLGIDEARMMIMRKNLKYLEGTYIDYSFRDGKDGMTEVVMYQKAKLDSVMAELMKDKNTINFKYIEEALEKAEENAAKKASK